MSAAGNGRLYAAVSDITGMPIAKPTGWRAKFWDAEAEWKLDDLIAAGGYFPTRAREDWDREIVAQERDEAELADLMRQALAILDRMRERGMGDSLENATACLDEVRDAQWTHDGIALSIVDQWRLT